MNFYIFIYLKSTFPRELITRCNRRTYSSYRPVERWRAKKERVKKDQKRKNIIIGISKDGELIFSCYISFFLVEKLISLSLPFTESISFCFVLSPQLIYTSLFIYITAAASTYVSQSACAWRVSSVVAATVVEILYIRHALTQIKTTFFLLSWLLYDVALLIPLRIMTLYLMDLCE